MQRMGIGEFARRSRLSPKALRLYDQMGLLAPAQVDRGTGYRWYGADQLESARLVAALRQLDVPLAEITLILGLGREQAAERVAAYWAAAEAEHALRRRLAGALVDRLTGRSTVMVEVKTRDIPSRTVLCATRHVDGTAGAWAFGQEFVALLRARALPHLEGRAGATYCIWWGEVSDDGDGPLEWCRPIPDDRAEAVAAEFPDLSVRCEPAHREAYVAIGTGGETSAAQWQLWSEALWTWVAEHGAKPSDLGMRITYLAPSPATEGSGPDCDVAVPLA